MAIFASSSSSSSLRPIQKSLFPDHHSLSLNSQPRPFNLRFPILRLRSAIRSSFAVSLESNDNLETDVFACPVCYEPLIRKGPSDINLQAIYRSGFKCRTCDKTYSSKDVYLDVTVPIGLKDFEEAKPFGTEFFRTPLMSFLYERGWRQYFRLSGFPGLDKEFEMAQEYFKPAEGGLLVDVSCGSGLFARKFAKSNKYAGVIALDFSENMLSQCNDFIKQDNAISNANLGLVRADISRLPFSSGSVDAVHAGAALHCWPSPTNAITEISRVLRSGGVFVGTTFLRYNASTPWILKPMREKIHQSKNYLTQEEIREVCKSSGLTNYTDSSELVHHVRRAEALRSVVNGVSIRFSSILANM